MRAVSFSAYGGPEVLGVDEDAPEPHAGVGQVRIAVRAASLNPFDWKLRSGMFAGEAAAPDAPVVPGLDAAGVVDEVGDGAAGVAVGDAVFGFTAGGGGGMAELAVLSHWAPKPADVDFPEAAGWPVAVETAARCLDLLALPAEAILVVNGASGGVGLAAVQFALARDLRVIGTASARHHDRLRALGAEVTTYGEGMEHRIRQFAPGGADGAIDLALEGGTDPLIGLTGDPARVVATANFAAAEQGVRVTSETSAYGALAEASALAARGRFSLPVGAVYDFAHAADAHRLSEGGSAGGKLVLTP